jgi:hypothetical protein
LLCSDRCFACLPSAGSGVCPANSAATVFFWLGMMTKKTLADMIVPISAPM